MILVATTAAVTMIDDDVSLISTKRQCVGLVDVVVVFGASSQHHERRFAGVAAPNENSRRHTWSVEFGRVIGCGGRYGRVLRPPVPLHRDDDDDDSALIISELTR
jgi:hypothetical protein